MKKIVKRIVNALIVTILVFLTPITAFASGNTHSKEEVIYGMLAWNGSVREAYVVNIFDEAGVIIDYGDYASVKNMTSNEEIRRNGKQVVIENDEDTLYYEGMLNNQELPWNISIQYFLDDVEYPAEELAGKSGALEIVLKIEENTVGDSFFFENYGVQATLVLDTEKAKNIVAEEATIANVGKNKQLTYTILPGKGADFSIQADVEDFEMDAIAINGIQLNLGLDFDLDDAALMAKVDELLSGVDRLDQGDT